MIPTILVPGTWGDSQAWWRQGSPFWAAAEAHGVSLLNGEDPYNWTTEIDGVLGKNRDWETAGDALRWYAAARGLKTVNLICHSHGGGVGQEAAAGGLSVDTFITVATPIRKDMEPVIVKARAHIARWIHLRSDASDWFQWFGEVMDGRLAWPGSVREFSLADRNVVEPGVGHSGLLDPALWTARGWWTWLQ